MKRSTIILLVLFAVTIATACRTKTSKTPQIQPAPAPVEASIDIVEPPSRDFVQDRVAVDSLPSDLLELNRLAHEKGWLQDAFFAYDESKLSEQAREALASSARWLRDNPSYALLLEGHCDERGTEEYNLALGERRANTAREYLQVLGISPDRLRTVSYGKERPFARGTDESAWAQNRRAHLAIVR